MGGTSFVEEKKTLENHKQKREAKTLNPELKREKACK